jgi:hypothetical protein
MGIMGGMGILRGKLLHDSVREGIRHREDVIVDRVEGLHVCIPVPV